MTRFSIKGGYISWDDQGTGQIAISVLREFCPSFNKEQFLKYDGNLIEVEGNHVTYTFQYVETLDIFENMKMSIFPVMKYNAPGTRNHKKNNQNYELYIILDQKL